MSQESLPPGMMFRSFLTVASAFVLILLAHGVVTYGIAVSFFPQFFDAPEAIPSTMFWIVTFFTTLASMLIGFYVIKTAPFSHFAHAVFVAVVLFISYLQVAIKADSPDEKSINLIYMVVFPLALLVGAKWTINRMIREYNDEENSLDLPG